MGFSYEIIRIGHFDKGTGLSEKQLGPIPERHRPYLSSEGRWTRRLADILFTPDPREFLESVTSVLNLICPYDDILEELVQEKLETFWTRQKHEGLIQAFIYFEQLGLYYIESA
uniref:Uncharacterized protein n=1 Tax=viral metagenome TaxID=1070528 RepID=A0A6C0APX7_9ZZZZ